MARQCAYPSWVQKKLPTPAMVFDEGELRVSLRAIQQCADRLSADVLYSIKACWIPRVAEIIAEGVQGISCSSPFEARLAREIIGSSGSVHMTSPALTPTAVRELGSYCDYLSFNSVSQLCSLSARLNPSVQRGLRVNPGMSFGLDERYDPCRKHSKLGVPLKMLSDEFMADPGKLDSVSGILIHSNCDSKDLSQLAAVVQQVEANLQRLLARISWINLGGGYLLDEPENVDSLAEILKLLRAKYGLRVFLEPGSAFVRRAGYLVCEVVDLISSEGKNVAVLDTTVNHLPEVFEYQFEPDVVGHSDQGANRYLLAGCTCLAGDVFGEYAFSDELRVGSRIVFENVGSYTTTKSNLFNGIGLPAVFLARLNGDLQLLNEFTYGDFRARI